MSTKHPAPTSIKLHDVGVPSLDLDLDALAAELSRQPARVLMTLIERIDFHAADWTFFEVLDKWMKDKVASEGDGIDH